MLFTAALFAAIALALLLIDNALSPIDLLLLLILSHCCLSTTSLASARSVNVSIFARFTLICDALAPIFFALVTIACLLSEIACLLLFTAALFSAIALALLLIDNALSLIFFVLVTIACLLSEIACLFSATFLTAEYSCEPFTASVDVSEISAAATLEMARSLSFVPTDTSPMVFVPAQPLSVTPSITADSFVRFQSF